MEKEGKAQIMVFGVFDGIHEGHRSFLNEAMNKGRVIIVVTHDSIVRALKNKTPKQPLSVRMEQLYQEFSDAKVIAGDELLNSWQVVLDEKPDIILLGYDQQNMKKTLDLFIVSNNLSTKIEQAEPFQPDKYHTSLFK